MNTRLIYGIQQVGIGVNDLQKAQQWYAGELKANIKIFEDHAPATYMSPYTGDSIAEKSAVMLLNTQGGGGFELWQYANRTPLPCPSIEPGDLGINAIKIRANDLDRARSKFKNQLVESHLSDHNSFFIADPFGNFIEISQEKNPKSSSKLKLTGITGVTIGVSDLSSSCMFYGILGFDKIECDESYAAQNQKFRKVVLSNPNRSNGRFGCLLGPCELTLIKNESSDKEHIFKDRQWGDMGYIHLCLDVCNLPAWVRFTEDENFPFVIQSDRDFKMGDAYGHWGYLEDPDKTLIEMVETLKLPIIKKFGLTYNLSRQHHHKPVPRWLINSLMLKKIS